MFHLKYFHRNWYIFKIKDMGNNPITFTSETYRNIDNRQVGITIRNLWLLARFCRRHMEYNLLLFDL